VGAATLAEARFKQNSIEIPKTGLSKF